MDFSSLRFLAVDLKTTSLVYLEYASQPFASKVAFAATERPLLLEKTDDTIFFLTSGSKASVLYRAAEAALAFEPLPVRLPRITQAALTSDGQQLYFIDAESTLTVLDISALELKQLARPAAASCVGLCTDPAGNIHTAWETQYGTAVATFDRKHTLCREYALKAIPTNIACLNEQIYITFTQSPTYGEGVAAFSPQSRDKICSFYSPQPQSAFQLYPCNLCFSPDGDSLYIINEDAASITCLSRELQIRDHFSLGHSISTLQLTCDPRFAVGGSNMFADLLLLDLVNKKILSISSCDAEFSSLFCLLP